ncbi:MAG: type VI secretion system ATPase TssH [Polyangiaceae bacterium]|nr:type VI secretion system ATPase TssH [Polyangiaceae bacterium]
MLNVEPKALLRKLNPTCTRALEVAAATSVNGRHYEVAVEHLLAALLDDEQSDVSAVLAYYRVDVPTLRESVQRSLAAIRGGNAGRPVFSSLLLELIQDALLYTVAELGEVQVRSGALLVRLVQTATRYLPEPYASLELLPRDELRQQLALVASTSGEVATVSSAEPGGGASPLAASSSGALARFTSDLTVAAREGRIDPVLGREPEIRQMIEILVRRRKNNPIIVGEAGVGKTALVEGLALRIVEGTVPDGLKKVHLLVLDLGALQAGAGVRGEFESRLKGVLSEVKASPIPIILFIDEAHTIIGAGGSQGGGDAANLLKPALSRGELRTIAATTYAEYKKYFEKDAALERRFQPVRVEEPSIETGTVMLRGLAGRFQDAHKVLIRDEAVRAAVALSSRYISGRQLPDKAVDLLDTAAAYVNLVKAAPPASLEGLRAALASVDSELAAMQRDEAAGIPADEEARTALQERRETLSADASALEERVATQRALVARIDELRAAGPDKRDELVTELARLSELPPEERVVAADVDENVVASIVADWTGIPVGKMVRDDLAAILALEDRLRQRVRGQEAALAVIGRELRAARSGLKAPNTPLGVFLLVGPSGVGKTETALALADQVFGGERFVVTINMSEFQERHTVSRLIGSPPGYVGFGEGGVLTEAVRHRPYSLVLLDEVEKADREVLNLFYQVFDKGMLADGEGRVIDFKNTVIVMTSNLATDLITSAAPPGQPSPEFAELVELVKPTLSAHFRPALLARMSVVPFIPIGPDALMEIVHMKLDALARRVRSAHRAELTVDEAVAALIAQRCTEVESGARNVDHILRGTLLPLVSSEILQVLARGEALERLRVRVTEEGAFACEAQPRDHEQN